MLLSSFLLTIAEDTERFTSLAKLIVGPEEIEAIIDCHGPHEDQFNL